MPIHWQSCKIEIKFTPTDRTNQKMHHRQIPTNIVIDMDKKGFLDVDILRYLKERGYTPVEISDAFNQAKIKLEMSKRTMERDELLGMDSADFSKETKPPRELADSQEEAPFNFRQTQILNTFQNQLARYLESQLKLMDKKIKIQEDHLQEIQNILSEKINAQSSAIKSMNAEVHALGQSFSKILEPLAHNVKVVSGMLDLKEEKKSSEKIEKEIKKEEKEISELEKEEGIVAKNVIKRQPGYLYFVDKEGNVKKSKMSHGGKRKSKKIIKTVTVTETKPTLVEKPKKSKKNKEKTEKSEIIKTTVTKTEVKESKKKKEPSLDDVF